MVFSRKVANDQAVLVATGQQVVHIPGVFLGVSRLRDYSTRSALALVIGFQTPQAIREAGETGVSAYLREHGARPKGIRGMAADAPSRAFHDRKRGERLIHPQALLAPARRLVDVLRALLRDGRTFPPTAPRPATTAA